MAILFFLKRRRGRNGIAAEWSVPFTPAVTTLLTVHNEEGNVEARIRNLLESGYPTERHEILIASDGSTDRTNAIVEAMARQDGRIRLFTTNGGGKSATQNQAILQAAGEIIVLTDAESYFKKNTISALVRRFADDSVGCVSGRLKLRDEKTGVAECQGFYWRYEIVLRQLESGIGSLHTASGQVMAFRKDLFRPFPGKFGDDCIIPLDVAQQGYRVAHAADAVAFDTFPSTMKGELRARTRMTMRNITCTLSKYHLLNPFKYPLLSFSILSHKILRWLTPYFMLGMLVTNIFLVKVHVFYLTLFWLQLATYFFGFVGFMAEQTKVRVPIASQIFSFLLANSGFFLGVLQAAFGKNITSYKNMKECQDA